MHRRPGAAEDSLTRLVVVVPDPILCTPDPLPPGRRRGQLLVIGPKVLCMLGM